jgi:PAS domain S-box-containing protein
VERVDPLRRALSPRRIRRLSPQLGSILLILALLILFTVLLLSRHRNVEVFSVLLGVVLAALAVVVFLLTRFLAVASEEQRQTAWALDAREREFQSVFEHALDAILILDEQGMCREANPSVENLLGVPRHELIGQPLEPYEELIHPEDRAHVRSMLDGSARTGEFDERFRIIRPGGQVRWVWARGFPVRDAERRIWRLVGTALEITALKQAEQDTARSLALAESAWAEAEALRKATLGLTQDLRMDLVLDNLLQALLELVPCECARVLLLEGESRLFVARETPHGTVAKKIPDYPLTLDASDSPFLERVLAGRASVLIPDTGAEREWRPFKGHTDVRCWLCVPLIAAGRTLGLFSVSHTRPGMFTQEHLRLAESLAIPAAAAIQNARLYETASIYGTELEKRIADLQQAKRALEQAEGGWRISEEKFEKVFRASPIAFSITTLNEGRFLDVNAAFEACYGYCRAELIGHTVHELGIWEDPTDRVRMVAQLERGGPIRNVITRLRAKSGEIKLTTYSADRIQFDRQACILSVSEEVLHSDPHHAN